MAKAPSASTASPLAQTFSASGTCTTVVRTVLKAGNRLVADALRLRGDCPNGLRLGHEGQRNECEREFTAHEPCLCLIHFCLIHFCVIGVCLSDVPSQRSVDARLD